MLRTVEMWGYLTVGWTVHKSVVQKECCWVVVWVERLVYSKAVVLAETMAAS